MSEQETPRRECICDRVAEGAVAHTRECDAQQETPRTVEEAAREEAEWRYVPAYPGTIRDRALLVEAPAFVAGAAWRAARMPSLDQVEAAMDEADRVDLALNLVCGCGTYTSQRHRRCRAERVVALWGAQ